MNHPNLTALMGSGLVWRREIFSGNPAGGYEYYGKADGVEVCFGCVFNSSDLSKLEGYFEEYPTPDKW